MSTRSTTNRPATATKASAAARKKAAAAARRRKAKPVPVCSAKDLRTPKKKRRTCTVPAPKKGKVSPTGPVAAPPVAAPVADAFPTPAPSTSAAPLVVLPPAPEATPVAPSPSEPTPTPAAPSATPAPTPVVVAVPPSPDLITADPISVPEAQVSANVTGVPVYGGPFGVAQAHRLLFRAGFGPTPGQAEAFAAAGLDRAVSALVNPASSALVGPAPTGGFLVGGNFAPDDRWGHIHLSFLDRAVRGADSLGERMTLILHDWLPVSTDGVDYKHVEGNLKLLRSKWRGSFRETLKAVTADPGMLQYLGGTANNRWSPNENYARELMELFALGADRGAYTETDVREMARAMTGYRMDWSDALRGHNFRYDPTFHDPGIKTVFAGKPYAKSGALTPDQAVDAVVDHALHPSFVVLKLWSYFVPTAPSAATQAALELLYRQSGEKLLPLVEAILRHPDLYTGASMVKNPVVFAAGLMRIRNLRMTSDQWTWMLDFAGMFVGAPPNVAGWNDRGWLNTSTYRGRWTVAQAVLNEGRATPESYNGRGDESSTAATETALRFWGNPPITQDVRSAVELISRETWARNADNALEQYWSKENFLSCRQNAMRQLVVTSPDFQVS